MSFLLNLITGVASSAASSAITSKVHARNAYSAPRKVIRDGVDTLYHNEVLDASARVFGIPGASLAFANLGKEQLEAGIKGEKRVAEALEAIVAELPDTYVFHSVKIPGRLGDIDHLVVRGNTVVLVDSKNWKKEANYELVPGELEDTVYRDGEAFLGGEIHLRRQFVEWENSLPRGYRVEGVLVVANDVSFTSLQGPVGFEFVNLLGLKNSLLRILPKNAAALPYEELRRFATRTQNPEFDPNDETNYVWVNDYVQPAVTKAAAGPVPKAAWWFMVWSMLNYVLLPLIYPIAALSAGVLIFFLHRLMKKSAIKNLGGFGLNVTTLIFSYLLMFVWMFGAALFLIFYVLPQA